MKAWGRELLAEFGRATSRAVGQHGVAHFLQNVLGMATGVAFVSINGHEKAFKGNAGKPQIIGLQAFCNAPLADGHLGRVFLAHCANLPAPCAPWLGPLRGLEQRQSICECRP